MRYALCLAAVLTASAARAQEGALDPTFGGGGIVRSDFGESEQGVDAARLPDGKLLVVGSIGTQDYPQVTDIALVRYHPDGVLDDTFGAGGLVRLDLDVYDASYALALLPDGRFLVGGTVGPSAFGYYFALMRFEADGTLDRTFGDEGLVLLDTSGRGAIQALAVQPDGRIVVVGDSYVPDPKYDIILARYLPDGKLDPTFGDGGVALEDYGVSDQYGYALALQPDGRIVVVGTSGSEESQNLLLSRYLPEGTLDPTFVNGSRSRSGSGFRAVVGTVALLPDGRVLLGGRHGSGGSSCCLALYRFEADGLPDATFGADGMVVTEEEGYVRALALLPDERALLVGSVGRQHAQRYDYDLVLARFLLGTLVATEPPLEASVLSLSAPSPNPFREAARLTLTVPSAQAVRVAVYDALGRETAVLHEGALGAGTHVLGLGGGSLAPGVYVVRAEGAAGVAVRRIVRY